MKKNFIIYIFIIFLLTSFSIFAQREVDTYKLVYNEKTQLIHYDNEKGFSLEKLNDITHLQ